MVFVWVQFSTKLCLFLFYPNSSLVLCDTHLSFSPSFLPPFAPAALPLLHCHICHGRSVAAVALGFKFNLVPICCNCFERRPCLHVFPLMPAGILDGVHAQVCLLLCVCTWMNTTKGVYLSVRMCVKPEQLTGHTLSVIHFVKHHWLSVVSLAFWQCACQTETPCTLCLLEQRQREGVNPQDITKYLSGNLWSYWKVEKIQLPNFLLWIPFSLITLFNSSWSLKTGKKQTKKHWNALDSVFQKFHRMSILEMVNTLSVCYSIHQGSTISVYLP